MHGFRIEVGETQASRAVFQPDFFDLSTLSPGFSPCWKPFSAWMWWKRKGSLQIGAKGTVTTDWACWQNPLPLAVACSVVQVLCHTRHQPVLQRSKPAPTARCNTEHNRCHRFSSQKQGPDITWVEQHEEENCWFCEYQGPKSANLRYSKWWWWWGAPSLWWQVISISCHVYLGFWYM